ncbi:DUF4810 domain-containing protein [Reinekea thalattae]|uniref:DUF4810 domain-containing protein n=1 Tax=Reinekea thalattae TaxID=2593301 RepID=A0A5C8Z9H0_9GAMM|nr:DUF4810 domain-containing protein [Reinekea thalattae]TXR54377.1 DUF4810 domain-containing protein [Reinekea thalattae]
MRHVIITNSTAILVSLLLCSCVVVPKYDWGSYEEDLLEYYSSPDNKAELATNLEKLIAKQEAKGNIPPPGLYAELGTLYLENHHTETAISFYQKEFDAWPESRPLMQRLITNLEAAL